MMANDTNLETPLSYRNPSLRHSSNTILKCPPPPLRPSFDPSRNALLASRMMTTGGAAVSLSPARCVDLAPHFPTGLSNLTNNPYYHVNNQREDHASEYQKTPRIQEVPIKLTERTTSSDHAAEDTFFYHHNAMKTIDIISPLLLFPSPVELAINDSEAIMGNKSKRIFLKPKISPRCYDKNGMKRGRSSWQQEEEWDEQMSLPLTRRMNQYPQKRRLFSRHNDGPIPISLASFFDHTED